MFCREKTKCVSNPVPRCFIDSWIPLLIENYGGLLNEALNIFVFDRFVPVRYPFIHIINKTNINVKYFAYYSQHNDVKTLVFATIFALRTRKFDEH